MLKLHTTSKCIFRAESPQPIVHGPQHDTRIGCPKRPKPFEPLSVSIGPFWYRLLGSERGMSAKVVIGVGIAIFGGDVDFRKSKTQIRKTWIE